MAGLEEPISTEVSTIPWDSNNGWADYMLDGPNVRNAPLQNGKVKDFGYYMNTNNLGNSQLANSQVGTTINNIYLGLENYYKEVGWRELVGMCYNKISPTFLGGNSTFPEYWKQNGFVHKFL